MNLTERDVKMLLLVVDGLNATEIANTLFLTPQAVGARLRVINEELGGDFLIKKSHASPYRANQKRRSELISLVRIEQEFRKLKGRDKPFVIRKASTSDVAHAMELRARGLTWREISMKLGKVTACTWGDYVKRAELLGFAAWG